MNKKLISFIVLITFLFSGSWRIAQASNNNKQLVFLVFNSRDIYGTNVYKNVSYTLQKNGIETVSWDLNKNEHLPPLDTYPILGMVTEQLYSFNHDTVITIKDYVSKGGKLIQFIRGFSDDLSAIFDIDNKFSPTDVNIIGLQFIEDFFPGCRELTLTGEDLYDDGLNYAFSKSIRPIAVSTSNIPLLWESSYGKGKTLYWNCTALNTKAFRGFIVASVTRYLEVSARKVIGKSVMFVDDFPSSSWRAKLEPTFSELGQTDTDFYSKTLLSDLIGFNRDFALRYSTVAVFNYNNIKEQPYTFLDWDSCIVNENGVDVNVPEKMFKILLGMPDTFEVGLHGYNHVQLTLEQWVQTYFMIGALASARDKWMSYSKNPPTFYVAPMNEIDQAGFGALRSIFPEINTICTLYESDYQVGCNREFGLEPWDTTLVDIPRLTSGYYFSSYDRFLAYSTMEAFGIWTHFIHPDDIYSNPTNYPNLPIEWIRNPFNLSWYGESTGRDGLYYRFRSELESMDKNFPWIEYDFATTAHKYIADYAMDDSLPIVTDNQIIFQNNNPQRYLVEIPLNYSLGENEKLEIIWSTIQSNKKVILVEADHQLSVAILPFS
jgi:hypothetical protein